MFNYPGSPDPRVWAMKKDLDILYKKFNTLAKGVTFTVKFSANGGTGTVDDTVMKGLAAAELGDGTGLTPPTGKAFAGWNTKADGTGTAYAAGARFSAEQMDGPEITLHAQWKPAVYGISYHLDGGTNGEGNPASYAYGTGVASFADASKEGYEFGGWFSDAEFETEVTGIADDATGDVDLYAKFTEAS